MLTTHLITARTDLAALETPWNILAVGEPMRSWNWLATWWEYYGNSNDRELHVLAVYDEDENGDGPLVGIAPWYIERSPLHSSALRMLGDGHVCTDHLSLVCKPDYVASVAATLAEYLTDNDDQWDRMELEAIDDGDEAMGLLIGELESRDALVSCQKANNCWVISLPESWDEYTSSLSSSHRRQLRLCEKQIITSGRIDWHHVSNSQELDEAWPILVDLHQGRRKGLGEPGCFASQQFHDFHRDIAGQLLKLGQLRLSWSELDGAPFTAEYHFSSPATVYTYQCGLDTNRLQESPGRVAWILTLKRAIADGFPHLDFLRGDERYKAHFRAEAKPTFDYLVFPNRRFARLRGHVMLAAGALKHWVKQNVVTAKS
jgi:CelD/BcsL family acetyltransferase involved in cellulose biosynthesis